MIALEDFPNRRGAIDLPGSSEFVRNDVVDQGPGLAPDEVDRVFEQYYCKDRSPESKSTGVGLSIAQGIVRYTGGRIWVEGESGCGATFHIAPPAMLAVQASPDEASEGNIHT